MKKIDPKAMNDRIILLRTQHSGPRGKSLFARELGISASTYNYYEKDRVPPIETLLNICDVTGADLTWLLTGQTGQNISHQPPINAPLVASLNKILEQKPQLAGAIAAFIDLLSQKNNLEENIATTQMPSQKRPGWIPVLGRTAAGIIGCWDQVTSENSSQTVTELEHLVSRHIGKNIVASAGGTLSVELKTPSVMGGLKELHASVIQVNSSEDQNDIAEFVQCEQVRNLFPDSFALRIDGDSMSPRINDGDIVMLSPSVKALQGQTAVARIKNQIGVTCKLIRITDNEVHLIPINERYETKVVPKKDLLWALAVLCHIRTS